MAGTVFQQIWNLDSSRIGATAVPALSPAPGVSHLQTPAQRTGSPTTQWPWVSGSRVAGGYARPDLPRRALRENEGTDRGRALASSATE